MTGQIILLIVLIAMTAALTYCESSVASLSDSKIEKIIENSDKKSQNLKKLWKRREKFLTAAHSAVMLAALLSSALACHSFAKPLAELTAKKTDLFSEAFFGYLFAEKSRKLRDKDSPCLTCDICGFCTDDVDNQGAGKDHSEAYRHRPRQGAECRH